MKAKFSLGEASNIHFNSPVPLVVFFAFAVFAPSVASSLECTRPSSAPVIPNGSSATLEQMVRAQAEVAQFIRALDAYIECNKRLSSERLRTDVGIDGNQVRDEQSRLHNNVANEQAAI